MLHSLLLWSQSIEYPDPDPDQHILFTAHMLHSCNPHKLMDIENWFPKYNQKR